MRNQGQEVVAGIVEEANAVEVDLGEDATADLAGADLEGDLDHDIGDPEAEIDTGGGLGVGKVGREIIRNLLVGRELRRML